MTEIIIAVISSSALSAIISGVFTMAIRRSERRTGALAGIKILLYDRIKYLCEKYISLGLIPLDKLEDLMKMHGIYHDDLGGNGFLDDQMEKVKALPVKTELQP